MKIVCVSFFFLINILGFGQSDLKIRYFTTKGVEVRTMDRSDYYEVSKSTLSENDTIKSYYTSNGQVRLITTVDSSGSPNGPFIWYHKNGQLKSRGESKAGKPSGVIASYYPNGSIQSEEKFAPNLNRSLMINYYDSAGNQLVKEGNGFCHCYFYSRFAENTLLEKGNIVEGLRDGEWIGYKDSKTLYFKETFERGKLNGGMSYDTLGNAYSYIEREEAAMPRDGIHGFYNHISKQLKYPREARKNGVQGKVSIEFVINRDGSLSDFVAISKLGFGCEEEAIRAIKTYGKWLPGKQMGQPVRQRMVLPLIFRL